MVKKLSCVDLIKFLLDEYSKSCAVQEYYSRGYASPDREQWGQRNGFRRSVKYLAEKMLECLEESKQVPMDVQPTDFEYLIELTEIAFDFSVQSATIYGISRERTIYELYDESPNPYKQYYDLRIADYDHEDFENAHLLFRRFVSKYGSLHQNIIEDYKSNIKGCDDKSCLYLRDFFEIFYILMHLDYNCNDIFIQKNEFKTKLATHYNISIDSINLFLEILARDIHHQSNYIKNYLKYAYKERTKKINNIEDQYLKIINNEEIQTEKNKNITESLDFFNKTVKTDMFNTFYKTTKPKEEMFSTFYKLDLSTRTSEIDSLRELMKSRDTLKMQFKEKINAENIVIDVLKNYILNNYDYAYMLQAYKDTVEILGKDYDDEVKLFKLLSSKKEEEIKNQLKKFTAKDKNNITKLLEEIEFNQLLISEEVMAKLREFIK